ncbi:MAG TPA: RDD family protein [Thermoplasmata archaeon]|nr:RDD family protein [Thermoplasmata archaeon]
MVNGLDLLGRNRTFQIHWLRRFIGFAIDLAFVFAPLWIFLYYLGQRQPIVYGLWGGVVLYTYSTLAEAFLRTTVGKYIAGLEVRSVRGPMTFSKAAVRNFPKLFWFAFPFIDVLAGLIVEGDPRQRWSDKVLGTTVAQSSLVHVRVHRWDSAQTGPR